MDDKGWPLQQDHCNICANLSLDLGRPRDALGQSITCPSETHWNSGLEHVVTSRRHFSELLKNEGLIQRPDLIGKKPEGRSSWRKK